MGFLETMGLHTVGKGDPLMQRGGAQAALPGSGSAHQSLPMAATAGMFDEMLGAV